MNHRMRFKIWLNHQIVKTNNTMNTKLINIVRASLLSGMFGTLAYAGVPLSNLEGTGGVAFNPLA